MTDCPNADVRDLLPDLVHGRLDAATRARVEAHVDGCAACAAELALLRDMRESMRGAPTIDVAAIVAAVQVPRPQLHRSWVGWRIAAAVTVLVGGASSLLVLRGGGARYPDTVSVQSVGQSPVMVTTPLPAPAEPRVAPNVTAHAPQTSQAEKPEVRVAQVGRARELTIGGASMGDLSDRELNALLKAIDQLDAVPTTDVENAALSPLSPRKGTP